MIIGICGPARSGKGEAAKVIKDMFGFDEYSFASPIRNFMIDFLGLAGGLAELDEIKDLPHYLLNEKTPRYAMQTLGTEWGRDMIWSELWVNRCIKMSQRSRHAVISDVRFDNEAKAINNAGGVIIKVVRPDIRIKESSHSSEKQISEDLLYKTITNDSDIWTFRQNVFSVVDTIIDRVGM